jgi:hypothetical protein
VFGNIKIRINKCEMGLPINEPRVPEPHAEVSIEDEKLLSDLYIRTSWFDAALALDQIEKVTNSSFLVVKKYFKYSSKKTFKFHSIITIKILFTLRSDVVKSFFK